MKKVFVLIAAIVISAATFAQGSTTAKQTGAPTTAASKKTVYVCPKCGATSDKAGNCSHCKVAMIQEGMYYCPKCYGTSAKAGKCPKCKVDMVQMEAKPATNKM